MGRMLRALCIVSSALLLASSAPVHAERVTFEEAMRRVIERNHGLRASLLAAESARAAADQAAARPNPRAEARLEDLGREELEIAMSQTIELGGKRPARMAIARAGEQSAALAHDARAIELEAETLRRFAELLAAERRVDLMNAAIELAESVLPHIGRRVAAGAARESDLLQARIAFEELRAERGMLVREVEKASFALAELWGAPARDPFEAAGELAAELALPSADSLRALMRAHPAARRFAAGEALAAAELAAARAERFPDIDIGAGVVRYGGTGDAALALSASVPLPVFNRNAAAERARLRLVEAAAQDSREAATAREAELLSILAQIAGTDAALGVLDEEIIPRAERAFALLKNHYDRGDLSFLELNESRRDIVRMQLRRIDLLAERAGAAAAILALTGHRAAVFTEN